MSREVGAGAVGTRGASKAALRREASAGAQATRGGPEAALSQEAGTTPPPPLLHRPTALAPDPCHHHADSAAAVRSGRHPIWPPRSHLRRSYTTVKLRMSVHRILSSTYSPVSPSVVLPM
jgi:hypothetical protein